jgi:hypothetical protein
MNGKPERDNHNMKPHDVRSIRGLDKANSRRHRVFSADANDDADNKRMREEIEEFKRREEEETRKRVEREVQRRMKRKEEEAKSRRPAKDVAAEFLSSTTNLRFPSSSTVLEMLRAYDPTTMMPGDVIDKKKTRVEADILTGQPSLILDALDLCAEEFGVPLGKLKSHTDPYGLVLLGPSGAGKTRRVLQYLAEHLGFFMPYKAEGDVREMGSNALREALKCVDMTVTKTVALRDKIELAAKCTLTAYDAVLREWEKRNEGNKAHGDRVPAAWLIMQMYPIQTFGSDVFAELAVRLFNECDPSTLASVEARACFIDEAQGITALVPPEEREVRPSSFRSALSPVISGIKSLMGEVLPVLVETGSSIVLEYHPTTGAYVGVRDDATWAYHDFPPLKPAEVCEMLKKRVQHDEDALNAAGSSRQRDCGVP